jgi:hypothetical protein
VASGHLTGRAKSYVLIHGLAPFSAAIKQDQLIEAKIKAFANETLARALDSIPNNTPIRSTMICLSLERPFIATRTSCCSVFNSPGVPWPSS